MFLSQYWWAYAICGVVILYYGVRMILQGKEIKIRGFIPFKWSASGLMVVILAAVAFIRIGFNLATVLLVLLIAVTTAITCLVPSGISDRGVFVGARLAQYEKIQYYAFENNLSDGQFRLRIYTGYRDLSLGFPEEEKEHVRAYMTAQDVLTFAEYKAKKSPKRK